MFRIYIQANFFPGFLKGIFQVLWDLFLTQKDHQLAAKKTPPEAKEMKLDLSHFVFLSADWGLGFDLSGFVGD